MNDKITCDLFLKNYNKCIKLTNTKDNCKLYIDIYRNCLYSCKIDLKKCQKFLNNNKNILSTNSIIMSIK